MSHTAGTTDSGSGHSGSSGNDRGEGARAAGRNGKAAKYAVPVAVLAVAAASIGLVPALASGGDPDLPEISAEELIAKIAESDVEQFSGTVETSTDFGLPGGSLEGLMSGGAPTSESGDVDPASKLRSLLTGEHTVKVAVDGADKQRAGIAGDAGEYTYVHNAGTVWGYDSAAKTAYKGTAPKGDERGGDLPGDAKGMEEANPQQLAKELLATLEDTTSVSVSGTTSVADRDAYQLSLKPRDAPDSTIEDLRIAVDAENGVPLKITLNAASGGDPIGELGFSDVDFSKPDASTFDFTPPRGTKIVEDSDLEKEMGKPNLDQLPGLDGIPGLEGLDGLDGLEGLDGLDKGEGAKSGVTDPENVEVLGKGWSSVLAVKTEGGSDAESGERGPSDAGQMGKLLDAFRDRVEGDFGTGRVVSTKVVNVLLTDDGSVYVGAVTKEGLVKAANANAG